MDKYVGPSTQRFSAASRHGLRFLLITVVIFASLMYTIERGTWDESMRVYISDETGKPSMFQSIVHGIYFGIVTSTTVGYGDQYPVTTLGKVVGGIGCICGILIMVIPISIFSNNFELIFCQAPERNYGKKGAYCDRGFT